MLENTSLGVMWGRVLPKFRGRYPVHPMGRWHEEFYLASISKQQLNWVIRKLGLDLES